MDCNMKTYRIDLNRIRSLVNTLFIKTGITPEDADIASEILISSEMRGVRSHGLMRIEKYVERLLSGGIHAKAHLDTISEGPCWTNYDANGSLGLVAGYKAMEHAIEKAKNTGVAIALVKNSRHFGAAGYYSLMCARKGMVGVSMSNGDVIMAVTGSNKSTIGNNPFSFAAPAGCYGLVMLDMAMSKYSDGKIQIAHSTGQRLESNSILDKYGNETTVPLDYLDGGTLLPFGGHKGYGLAVMVESLAGVLTGSSLLHAASAWNTDPDSAEGVGHFFLAMDIETIMRFDEYTSRMESMIEELHSAPKQPGIEKVFFPGELEMLQEKKAREEGLYILESCYNSLERTCTKLGIDKDWLVTVCE